MKWYSEVYFDESELFQDYTHEYIRKKGGNLTVLHTGRSVYAQHQFRCKETLDKKKVNLYLQMANQLLILYQTIYLLISMSRIWINVQSFIFD